MTITGTQILAVMAGGSLGALLRFVLSITITNRLGNAFPYGILTINVIGSFLMGFLSLWLIERLELDPLWRLVILVGFLGAFTTFSTFSIDTLNLFLAGHNMRALLNIFSNVFLSITAVWLGMILGKQFS